MRRLLLLLSTLPLLWACSQRKGSVRIYGELSGLDQADFLIFSPDGATSDIDTLHLTHGRFDKEIPLRGGPYTFTLVYPNYQTLTFLATEGAEVSITGDALALADVRVEGADSICEALTARPSQPAPQPSSLITQRASPTQYLLIGFWANWKGGTSLVNTNIARALRQKPDSLRALSVSLDLDPQMARVREAERMSERWETTCDRRGFDGALAQAAGVDNLPLFILLAPGGKVIAQGGNYNKDIAPTLEAIGNAPSKP